MSLVATILFHRPVDLPKGTLRKIGAHEADGSNAYKGRIHRATILAMLDKTPRITAKIAAEELNMSQPNALLHLHRMADFGDLEKIVEKRLVFFQKPRRLEIDEAA